MQNSHGQKAEISDETLALGDIVLVYDLDQPRTLWKMGRVEVGSDGVRFEVYPCMCAVCFKDS